MYGTLRTFKFPPIDDPRRRDRLRWLFIVQHSSDFVSLFFYEQQGKRSEFAREGAGDSVSFSSEETRECRASSLDTVAFARASIVSGNSSLLGPLRIDTVVIQIKKEK